MIKELLELSAGPNYLAFKRQAYATNEHSLMHVLCGLEEVPRVIMTVNDSTIDRFISWGSPLIDDKDLEAIIAFMILVTRDSHISADPQALMYGVELLPLEVTSLSFRLQTWPSIGQRTSMPMFINGLPAIKTYLRSHELHPNSIMRIERK